MKKETHLPYQGTCTSQKCADLINNKFFLWSMRTPKYQSTVSAVKKEIRKKRSKDIKKNGKLPGG